MLLPLNRTCSVSRPNRLPWQTGQVTQTSARKSISSRFDPLPSQASQRPPVTLKLNRPGAYPRALASGSRVYRSRIWSNSLMYVAGLERGVRPIGDWSMSMTLSRCSRPSIPSCAPGSVIAPFKSRASASRRMSPTSELFPEPDTPVTQMNSPSGNIDVDPFQVIVPAPLIVSNRSSGTLRFVGNLDRLLARQIGAGQALRRAGQISDRPLRDHFAAFDAGARAEVDKMIGRAHRVFVVLDDDDRVPLVRQPLQGASSRSLSRGCRPIDGSSRTYSTPTSPAPTWLASRIRCASPPESVGAERSSAR